MAQRSRQSVLVAGACALVCALGAAPAHAAGEASQNSASACPRQPSYPLPADRSALQALAGELDPLALDRRCINDALFQAWRGAVLMALGEYTAAVEPLERALLLQPDLPSAQLDLALAFAHVGDRETAKGMLAQLEQRPDLPTGLRPALARQRQRIDSGAIAAGLHSRWQFSVLAGAESNLNNAPAVNELTLTLPGGNQTLPLAPSSLPRKGAALLTSAQWQGVRAAGPSLWLLQAEARARQSSETSTGFRQADLAATWLQAPEAPRQWIARGAATWLEFGGKQLLRTVRASAQYQWGGVGSGDVMPGLLGGVPCRPALGAELDDRHFPQTPELDGLYRGLVASFICPGKKVTAGNGSGPTLFTMQFRAGADKPQHAARPGGDEHRYELRAQWERPVASPWKGVLGPGRLGLQGAVTRQNDTSGYSPLLENNAVRHLTRYALQGEVSFALGGGLFAVTTAEASVQRSNLPAFTGRQRSLYFGLRWELM